MVSRPSPDSQLLSLIASQVATPDCLFPILPYPVVLHVWDISITVVATHHQSVLVHLKDPSSFPSRPQFPISETHHLGLKPIITCHLSQGCLIVIDLPCELPFFLARDLSTFDSGPSTLLQYVDGLLLCSPSLSPTGHLFVPKLSQLPGISCFPHPRLTYALPLWCIWAFNSALGLRPSPLTETKPCRTYSL